MKKGTFKIIAESMKLDLDAPTNLTRHRKMTIDEIKECIMEEFGKAKAASDVDVQDKEKGWSDADLELDIDFIKKLEIKEFFDKKSKK